MAFTLQLLSASDLEGGVEAITNAPNFAAIVEALEAEAAAGGFASILLSAGDNIISGPFFNAASDTDTFNPVLEGFYNTFPLFDWDGDGEREPLIDISQIPLATADIDNNGFLDVGEIDAFLNGPDNTGGLTAADVFVGDVNGDGFPDYFDEINLVAGGTVDYSIMNLLGFDASALGNHEFDLGSNLLFQAIQFEGEQGNGLSSTNEASVLAAFPGHQNFLQEVDWPGIQFPYLSANLDFSEQQDLGDIATTDLLTADDFATDLSTARDSLTDFTEGTSDGDSPKIAPSTIVEVEDPDSGTTEQIGVIGATTPLLGTISSPDGVIINGTDGEDDGTSFIEELAPIIQAEIDRLTDEGVNKIVLVSHLQEFEFELQLAGLLTGVDIIVAGGSDTLIADAEDVERGLQPGDVPDSDNSFDEEGNAIYPAITQDMAGNPVAIVSTDGEYSYVSRLVIEFNDQGVIVPESVDPNVSGAFATTDAGVAALTDGDPFAQGTDANGVQGLVNAVSGVVSQQDGTITGQSAVFLNGLRAAVRTQETNFGVLAGRSLIDAAQDAGETTVFAAVRNGGGIRDLIGFQGQLDNGAVLATTTLENPTADKEAGDISQLDIANTLRFNNGVTLLSLTPTQLLEVLEHGVSAANATASNEPGQFPQVAGIRFSFDPTQDPLPFTEAVDADGDGIADGLSQGSRVQTVAVQTGVDADGDPIFATVVENGMVVEGAPQEIRIATLNFLAGAFGFPGDGYPFLAYTQISEAGAAFQNQVTLSADDLPAGEETFAPAGTEQDALAELLATEFDVSEGDLPFLTPDKGIEEDTLIQNLAFRETDTVLGALPGMDMDGTATADTLTGAEFADDIDGGAGNDTLDGAAGDDILSGEVGDDTVMGGDGDDMVSGGDGSDMLDGGGANDMLDGGSGNDTMMGGTGADIALGGSGNDMADTGASNDVAVVGSGNDMGIGGEGDDVIVGESGADVLVGGMGDDQLMGGSGNDMLIGGEGEDQMTGGTGADTFVFGANSAIDTILDFTPGRDLIDLTGLGLTFADLDISGTTDTNIELSDGNLITLVGVAPESLTESDFIFG